MVKRRDFLIGAGGAAVGGSLLHQWYTQPSIAANISLSKGSTSPVEVDAVHGDMKSIQIHLEEFEVEARNISARNTPIEVEFIVELSRDDDYIDSYSLATEELNLDGESSKMFDKSNLESDPPFELITDERADADIFESDVEDIIQETDVEFIVGISHPDVTATESIEFKVNVEAFPPDVIENSDEFLLLAQSNNEDALSRNYELGDDIDLSGLDSVPPIGDSSTEFTGSFDGRMNEIYELTVDQPNTDFAGLFGYVDGGPIENIGIINPTVSGSTDVGSLGGRIIGDVERVYAEDVTIEGSDRVGGLVGRYRWDLMSKSYVHGGTVEGTDEVGGLVGLTGYESDIQDSYANVAVIGESSVGGIVGDSSNYASVFERVYAVGAVEGDSNVGGLVGVQNDSGDEVIHGYWDSETTGQESSAIGGQSLSTKQMQGDYTHSYLHGFDFLDTWDALENEYPVLQWQDEEDIVDKDLLEEPGDMGTIHAELEGEGTDDNPYHITDVYELQSMSVDLDAHYRLANDILASTDLWNDGDGFEPIVEFNGVLDGNGFTIHGLSIDRPSQTRVGLIAYGNGFSQNLLFRNAYVRGDQAVGVLGGGGWSDDQEYGVGDVERVGVIDSIVQSNTRAAGIAARPSGETIRECFVIDSTIEGVEDVGGICGRTSSSHIYDSYARATVRGENLVGGIVGSTSHGTAIIRRVYGACMVEGDTNVGPLVGASQDDSDELTDMYWDEEMMEEDDSASFETPLETAEMQGESASDNLSGFDFISIWQTHESQYPTLRSNPEDEYLSTSLTIHNPNDVLLEDHPVLVELQNESEMTTDFSGLRFHQDEQYLHHWIEAIEDDTAMVWVRSDKLPATDDVAIEARYDFEYERDNASAGEHVFWHFDDFSTDTSTEWTDQTVLYDRGSGFMFEWDTENEWLFTDTTNSDFYQTYDATETDDRIEEQGFISEIRTRTDDDDGMGPALIPEGDTDYELYSSVTSNDYNGAGNNNYDSLVGWTESEYTDGGEEATELVEYGQILGGETGSSYEEFVRVAMRYDGDSVIKTEYERDIQDESYTESGITVYKIGLLSAANAPEAYYDWWIVRPYAEKEPEQI